MNVSISPPSSLPAVVPGLDSATKPDLGLGPVGTAAGRGVLDGAFAVLDALAHADEGLGLTGLARVSGLAKTSAHRLAEHLVTLGAVQCVEHRYYVGPRMLRIGERWQPDPLLRRSAQAPVHALAVHSHTMASLCPTATPTCPTPPTPNRSPAPPPDASSTRPNPPIMSRFLTAGPAANGP